MKDFRVGEIIKVKVIGYQHYGIFIKAIENEEYTGLIHISEISNDFVKDVSKVAHLGDFIFAKVLDVDETSKHIKLSIKAAQPKIRYKSNNFKQRNNPFFSDFSSLDAKLNGWIEKQLKEKKFND